MKKCILLLLTATVFIAAFAVDFERKNFDSFGFSMKVPKSWELLDSGKDNFSYKSEGAVYYFYYNTYPYDSAGSTYADYSVLSDETRADIISHSEDVISDDYYEFDILFYDSGFKVINNKTFLCLRYDGLLWDEYYDDYSLPELFDEMDYIVLRNGKLHNFSIYIEESYFEDKDLDILYKMVESVEFE